MVDPAAVVVEATRKSAGVSVREAARRAQISEGRWRQIAKGFQSAGGAQIPVNAPAATLARMALAVDAEPGALARGGASQVAAMVRAQLAARDAVVDLSGVPDDVLVRELLGRLLAGRALRDLIPMPDV